MTSPDAKATSQAGSRSGITTVLPEATCSELSQATRFSRIAIGRQRTLVEPTRVALGNGKDENQFTSGVSRPSIQALAGFVLWLASR
jgi:hypothetical protein